MNREIIGRLKELEEYTGVTRDEYERALERMRCRYLLFLESKRRACWEIARVLRPASKKAAPDETYEPREMTKIESEQVRQHMQTYRLPCSSLKTLAGATPFLGVDSRENVLEDLEVLRRWENAREGTGVIWFHWERWIVDNYAPMMNAIEAWNKEEDFAPMLDLRIAEMRRSSL
jgi:hypothetical protein